MIRNLRLKSGTYTVELYLGRSNIEVVDYLPVARTLEIAADARAQHSEEYPGVYRCEFTHSIDYTSRSH